MAYDDVVNGTNGGPTYRWKFNGNTTEQNSGPSWTHGSPSYVPTIIPLDSGSCLDVANDDMNIANQDDINGKSSIRKILQFWIKPDTLPSSMGIYEEGGGTHWITLYTVNSTLYFNSGNSENNTGYITAPLTLGNTYHIIAELQSTPTKVMNLYVNGSLVDSITGTYADPFPSHVGDITLSRTADCRDHNGTTGGKGYYDGKIADFSYWANPSRLLTANEVLDIYIAGNGDPNAHGSISSLSDTENVYDFFGGVNTAGGIGVIETTDTAFNPEGNDNSSFVGSILTLHSEDMQYSLTGCASFVSSANTIHESSVQNDIDGSYVSNAKGNLAILFEYCSIGIVKRMSVGFVPWVLSALKEHTGKINTAMDINEPDIQSSYEDKPKVAGASSGVGAGPKIKDAINPY